MHSTNEKCVRVYVCNEYISIKKNSEREREREKEKRISTNKSTRCSCSVWITASTFLYIAQCDIKGILNENEWWMDGIFMKEEKLAIFSLSPGEHYFL